MITTSCRKQLVCYLVFGFCESVDCIIDRSSTDDVLRGCFGIHNFLSFALLKSLDSPQDNQSQAGPSKSAGAEQYPQAASYLVFERRVELPKSVEASGTRRKTITVA